MISTDHRMVFHSLGKSRTSLFLRVYAGVAFGKFHKSWTLPISMVV